MPRRSQRSRMRPSPSTVSDRRVGREAAPQEQEQVGRRAPHRDVGRDAAVAPADAEDAVVGPERPRLRRCVGRHEPDGATDVDPVAAAEDRRAPDLEQLVDPVGRQHRLDRLGLADRPLRVPAVDGGLLRLPPGPEPPDIGVGGEVPDRCVVVDRGQRVGEGPDPGVEPVGDRLGLPRRPLQRAFGRAARPSPRRRWPIGARCRHGRPAGRRPSPGRPPREHRGDRRAPPPTAPRPPCGPRPRSRWAGRNRGRARSECTGRR